MVQAIQGIYENRRFTVIDGDHESTERSQLAGISQGCPLSPFLFGIVMTILMQDAYDSLSPAAKSAHHRQNLGDVLYADDTLILGACAAHVEEYMQAIEQRGMRDGLQMHWGKVQLVQVSSAQTVRLPDGRELPSQDTMVYLGASLHSSGRSISEVSRRIGLAASECKLLSTVWKHAAITLKRKLELFNSIVVSRLRYATASTWLLKRDLKRLDGFFCSCLRRILRIPHSYYSRVSNASVLQRAGCKMLSESIRDAQITLLGNVLHNPAMKVLREASFHDSTMTPQTAAWVRRRGRPRQNWIEQVMKMRTDA
jgi:hypothetical protein